MRYLTLFTVDLTLLMLATLIAFALRENFEFAESRFEALLPYLGATVLMATILVPVRPQQVDLAIQRSPRLCTR